MDLIKACELLKLNKSSLNETRLKTAYYKAALQYHPDKNRDKNSNQIFIEIKEAYEYLNTYMEVNYDNSVYLDDEYNQDYYSTLSRLFAFLLGKDISIQVINDIIKQLKEGINTAVSKQLDKYDTSVLTKLYNILIEYVEVIGVYSNYGNILQIIREKIHENTNDETTLSSQFTNDIFIVLNPTINNLLNADVYKLNYEDDILCVPLWHDEIVFEYNHKKIIVKCVPELSNNIFIGADNCLHVNITLNVNDLFNEQYKLNTTFYKVNIGNKVFEINISDLKFKPFQTISLYNMGIPTIDIKDFYSIQKKNNIYIHVHLQNK